MVTHVREMLRALLLREVFRRQVDPPRGPADGWRGEVPSEALHKRPVRSHHRLRLVRLPFARDHTQTSERAVERGGRRGEAGGGEGRGEGEHFRFNGYAA